MSRMSPIFICAMAVICTMFGIMLFDFSATVSTNVEAMSITDVSTFPHISDVTSVDVSSDPRADLTYDDIDCEDIEYGEYISLPTPNITGFQGTDTIECMTSQHWYYNTTSFEVDEENWLPAEGLLSQILDVGTYYIKFVATFDDYNDVISMDEINISPKEVVFTWYENAGDDEGYMGADIDSTVAVGTYTYDGTSHEPHLVISGLIDGDDIPEYTKSILLNTSLEQNSISAGEHTITITALSDNNYSLPQNNSAMFVIDKAPLSVVATDKSVTYGNAIPSYTVSYTGFVEGEDEDVLDGEIAFSCQYSVGTGVGTYSIIASGLTSDNYDITFVNGTVTVSQRRITLIADDKTSSYGDEALELTATVGGVDGSIVGDDEVYDLMCFDKYNDSAICNRSRVGSYIIYFINCDNPNYELSFVNAKYTVTARPVTITIADKTSVYGEPAEDLTCSATSGSIVDDDINVYSLSCDVTPASNVGKYAITGSACNSNYDITFVNGEYTVTARPITVTIADKTSVYGEEIVSLTGEVTEGTVVNDDINVYSLSCEVSTTAGVDVYAITGVKGSNNNYEIMFVNGEYTITCRVVTLTWGTSTFVYDGQSHVPVAVAGNIVNGDSVDVVVGGSKVNAGEYTATATALSNANYALPSEVTHTFTITKPASYTKTIDPADAEVGVDLTDVFKNIDTTDINAELELIIGTTKFVFDRSAIEEILDSTEMVVLTLKIKRWNDAHSVDKNAVLALDISLNGATFENGTVTITTIFEEIVPVGKMARVYLVDAGGNKTRISAMFNSGTVTFKTNHFSNFVVTYDSSALFIVFIVILVLIFVAVFTFVIRRKMRSRHRKYRARRR